jgi:hypothetical protein
MRSFTDNGAQQSIFLDPTSPTFFAHFSKMNSNLDGTNDKTLEQAKNGFFLGNNESERVESNPSVTLPNETEKQDVGNMDEKKMKRVLANRRSARESYQRRKKMFSELEGAVTSLTKENAGLADENKKLRRQVMGLHQQLGLQQSMPGNSSIGNSIGSGMGNNSLALQQLAAQQQQQQSGQRSAAQQLSQSSGAHQGSQQQQQLAQQQGELDQLLELILKGRSS